jgi:ABC-type uncharacterized transport system substrate-binding protein
MKSSRVFYGWWIVLACGLVAVIGWSLSVFGMGVYIHALSDQRGFSISLVSTAVTVSYLVNAALLISVGTATSALGPKPVFALGTAALALSVAALGFCREGWQLFAAFAALGIGRACLSATAISTTLAPWFERYQGRAVSMALLGASVGGMIGTPLLLGGVALFGVETAFVLAGLVSMSVVLPVVFLVLKRRPQDLGLLPDGGAPSTSAPAEVRWSRKGAVATRQFKSQLIAFALAMLVQIGFLSHHVPLAVPILGEAGASMAVSLAALMAFVGRVLLARFADKMDLRVVTAGVMVFAAISLGYMSIATSGFALLLSSAMYGLTIGNLTTLSPLVARREFGAISFGAIYGLISAAIAFAMAFGPAVIGFLNGSSAEGYAPMVDAFRLGLREAGVVEGQSAAIEFRWADGHYEKLPQLIDDLLKRRVAVIVANTPANLVAKKTTSTVPIVFTTSSDPVAVGLVPNLNHPGGNVTGISQLNVEVGPKRLELARELKPNAPVGLLVNPTNPQTAAVLDIAENAERSLRVPVTVLKASTDSELERVFADFKTSNIGILTIGTDAFFNGRTRQLASLATKYSVPTIYQYAEFTAAGGLMSYGGSIKESYHLAGNYAAKILRGENPADLPVQQSTKVELLVNLKAARALGMDIPQSLLARADEVIE